MARTNSDDKLAVGVGCGVLVVWLIYFLLMMGLIGTVIWAIIQVVSGL